MRNLRALCSCLLLSLFHNINIKGLEDEKITLAVLMPFTGSRPLGKTIAGAIPLAVEDVNINPTLLQNKTLDFVWNDTECNARAGLTEAVNFWRYQEPFHAIIGGACSIVCEPVGLLAASWNIPMVSWGCSSFILSNKEDYPTFGRTVGPYSKVNPMLLSVMREYDWTRIAILTSSENVWQLTSHSLSNFFKENNITVAYFATFDPGHETIDGRSKTEHTQLVVAACSTARIIFVFAFGGDVRSIMLSASDEGFLDGHHVFFSIDITNDAYIGANTFMGDDGRDEEANEAFHALFNVHIRKPKTQEYEQFEQKVRQYTSEKPFNHVIDEETEIDVHAGPLYDAILMYATALDMVLRSGGDVKDGMAIGEAMRNLDFQGIDRLVHIDENGDRNPDYALQDHIDHSFHDFAHYAQATGNYSIIVEPVWPNDRMEPPLDHPPCGWDMELCPDTTGSILGIVFGVFCISMIILLVTGILIFRRMKYLNEFNAIDAWKLNYGEIYFGKGKTDKSSSGLLRSTKSLDTTSHTSTTSEGQKFCKAGIYRGTQVALKFINRDTVPITPDVIREVKEVRGLQHDNLNLFYGICTESPNVCIVTAYCKRGSLQDVLENDSIKLEENFKVSFANDICSGMIFLHNSDLKSHGKLKSSNVVIDGRWVAKVTDFGLHKFKEEKHSQQSKTETEIYKEYLWTAPELLRCPPTSQSGTQKGDVYSFGIILQEIALRGGPYCNQIIEAKEIVSAVKLGSIPVFRPHVPPDACSEKYRQLMERCWSERVVDRPDFSAIKKAIYKLAGHKQINIIDNMFSMMEKYANQLEELVEERTVQLEEEKKKTDKLLYSILPKSVADQLKLGQAVQAEQYALVTISFSDIVGFTKLASESTPLEVVNFLNDLYTLFDDIIDLYDVYKVETIGDAYMVASGLPERNGNRHASEICTLGIHLMSSVRSFKIRHRQDRQLQLRLGVHTGPVVAGVIGIKMPRFCLFGDTVNIASRMESTSTALRIQISQETRDILQDIGGFNLENRGEISIKGKAPRTTYWLLGKSNTTFELPDITLAAPMEEHEFK
ncbi:Atrial natriuretic peptide receptor 1 [Holothuria leucospilota]|uniref:Guanylate cyclase n=1 Tax=Holothuria leucospilota TaxID=206669 RepID=A0A9Q1BQJ5_HOLLE|nr:Atrial natriuretic peptide receptor 1 [Holothuria leucospilota]